MVISPHLLRRGIYKTERPAGMPTDVMVEDVNGGSAMELPEDTYRDRGYLPPFENVPTYDEYVAEQAKQRAAAAEAARAEAEAKKD